MFCTKFLNNYVYLKLILMVLFITFCSCLLFFVLILALNFMLNIFNTSLNCDSFESKFWLFIKKNYAPHFVYLLAVFYFIYWNTIFSLSLSALLILIYPFFLNGTFAVFFRIVTPIKLAYLGGGMSQVISVLLTLVREYFSKKMSELAYFFKNSILEIKIFFLLADPEIKLSENIRKVYAEKIKFFKYRKIDIDEKLTEGKTDEEILEISRRIKKLRDPRVKFNKVQRLPWKFKYNYVKSPYFSQVVSHISVFYNFFKTTLLAITLSILYFLYTIFFFKIQFLKQLSVWFVIGMLYFWLMSGFNFFLKRYQFGKFTSQIQRFWKRTNTYFWLIEGFLLLLFFYYYLNSSQEPLYMYDYSSLNQEYLISLYTVGINIILLSLVIYFMYFVMLRLNSNSWTQINLYLLVISVFVFFSFFIETYQFYYVISVFNERLWVLNEEDNLWGVDVDNPILRTKHQYLLVCLIAKYWHFLFIFLSWVFFLIKSFERKSVTYVLFGANLQNMIILYALNFACYLQWFKWIYRRFFDLPYTWFFLNIDNKFFFKLFFEIKLLASNLLCVNSYYYNFINVLYKSFFLWNVDSLSIWKFI